MANTSRPDRPSAEDPGTARRRTPTEDVDASGASAADTAFESEIAGIRARSPRDEVLAREGWSRRFVGAPPRLDETVEVYRSLGLEVRLEPVVDDELAERCAGCVLALTLFRVVYTRSPR